MTDDPWLRAMFDEVCDRMSAMLEARGDDLFSDEDDFRYAGLVRELAEINRSMHEAGFDSWFPRPPALAKERLTAAHIMPKPTRGDPCR